MGPTGEIRVVQIHPSRQCNLRCQHCYSSSSPETREALDLSLLLSAIEEITAENYNYVSFSGGEPFMYKPLAQVLRQVKSFGLNTAIATNGMLLNDQRLDDIMEVIDIIAISVDGIPESHNKMRGSSKAFDSMAAKLPGLRERNIAFGFIFTLTQYNLDELEWVVKFALDEGASLVQIHPLEGAGYAKDGLMDAVPDAIESAYGWLLSQQIQDQLKNRLKIQVDLTYSEIMSSQKDLFFSGDSSADFSTTNLGEILSPVIIETDGTVSPLQYGFPKAYSLGNLNNQSFSTLAAQWKLYKHTRFLQLCHRTHNKIVDRSEPFFFNWYNEMSRYAAV